MTKFTKEQLQQIAEDGFIKHGEAKAMARQLLASMEQEPVYQVWDWHWYDAEKHIYDEAKARGEECRILYAAPQLPQPAVAITQHFDTIALDTAKMVMCDVNRRDEFLGGDIQLLSRIQCRIDEACRAAMLRGAVPEFREISNSSTKHFRENAETSTKCCCRTCRPVTIADMRFVVCLECGNKRCPRANDHLNACTGSNEPGQEGSAYPATKQDG